MGEAMTENDTPCRNPACGHARRLHVHFGDQLHGGPCAASGCGCGVYLDENASATRSNALRDVERELDGLAVDPEPAPLSGPALTAGDLLGLHLGNGSVGREVVAGAIHGAVATLLPVLRDLASRMRHVEDRGLPITIATSSADSQRYIDTGQRSLAMLAADFAGAAARERTMPPRPGAGGPHGRTVYVPLQGEEAAELAAALDALGLLRQLVQEAIDIVEGGGEVDARDWRKSAHAALERVQQ
jgi:hypothetical protein